MWMYVLGVGISLSHKHTYRQVERVLVEHLRHDHGRPEPQQPPAVLRVLPGQLGQGEAALHLFVCVCVCVCVFKCVCV